MDPNVTLEIIDMAYRPSDGNCQEAIRNLREWLVRGGFQPDWKRFPLGARRYRRYCLAHGATSKRVKADGGEVL